MLLERMRGRYPDRDFASDDDFYGQINDDYDNYDKAQERERSLMEMFSSDPRSAAFLTSWRKGGNPAVELVRMFGRDFLDAADDPAMQEEMAAANKEYLDRVAENRHLEEEYRRNIARSLEELEAFQAERGMSDGQVDALMESVMTIIQDGLVGKFSPETLDMVQKAMSHDADVDMAGEEGEIRGRNARIEERLRRGSSTDGTARLDGRNTPQGGGKGDRMSVFDLARLAK